jgi:hypothetical protein
VGQQYVFKDAARDGSIVPIADLAGPDLERGKFDPKVTRVRHGVAEGKVTFELMILTPCVDPST